MSKSLLNNIEIGKLLISGVAVCVDPTGIAAAAFGADAIIHARDKLFKNNSDLTTLAKEIDKEVKAQLKTAAYNKPVDARKILPDMMRIALAQSSSFVEHDLDDAEILKSLTDRFQASDADAEHKLPAMISAFKKLYGPILKTACNDPRLKSALDPALHRQDAQRQKDIAKRQGEMEKKIDRLIAQNEGLISVMKKLAEGADIDPDSILTLPEMRHLGEKFGRGDIEDRASLVKFLTLKAEEYDGLRSEVQTIDDGLIRLSNLKAAAQDAINRVDLGEVEELLSRVQEVELEEAAKTAELRANNALLRGRVEQAYRILSAAADSFAAVDPLEPARRKILGFAERLGRHGMRFGGKGLPLSVEMMRQTADAELKKLDALLWAAGKNAEAIGLSNQGTRTDGPEGAQLLADAVIAYRAALEVYTRADHPVQWATTQNNLGVALQRQGIRTDGPQGAQLLADAVTAYRAALEVRTRADHPVHWAATKNNLGIALRNQGSRTDGPEGTQLLADAVTAYRAALEVRTRADHPVDWALTQNNLGAALRNQGMRTAGPQGAQLLADAVTAYRAALEVRTRADHPVDWALTLTNIAIALQDSAARPDAENPRGDLTDALTAVDGALEVFDPEHMSYDHAKATRLRDDIQSALDALPD